MKEMVAGVRVTGRTDSKLNKAMKDTERGLVSTGKTATNQSRIVERAANREQRAMKSTKRETGLLGRSFERAGTRARKFGQSLKKNLAHLKQTGKLAKTAGKGLEAIDNRYTAVISSVGAGATVMQVGNIQERFTRLGITAGITKTAVEKLKAEVYAVAQADDVHVDPEQLIAGIDSIIEKTGDLKFAQANIMNLGTAIQAAGAQGIDIGELFAEFQKMGITAPEDVMKALDILNVQGKKGAFTLQNLAALGPRVITAYTSAGRGGIGAIRELGAALQVIRQGVGSSEMGATAFEAVMRTLTDPAKIKQLEALGIELFDPEKFAEGKRVLRPINELMKEIVATTNGDKVELGKIFDAEAIRGFNSVASEYQMNGQVNSLDKFMAVNGDGETTRQDAARAAEIFNSSLTSIKAAWEKFIDKHLSKPVEHAASLLNSIGPSGTDAVFAGLTATAIGVGGLLLGRKVKGLFGKKGKDSVLGNIAGGVVSSAGVTPVEVINWPGGSSSFGSDYGFERKSRGKTRGKARIRGRKVSRFSRFARTAKKGKFSKIINGVGGLFSKLGKSKILTAGSKVLKAGGKIAGKAAVPVSIALNAVDLVSAVSSGDTKRIGGSVGGMAGSAAGALAGAAIGSIVPVIGTAVGGIVGGIIGSYGGQFAGEELGGLMESPSEVSKASTTDKAVRKGNTTNNFYITQQAGQSAKDLAREVAAILKRQNSGVLYDG